MNELFGAKRSDRASAAGIGVLATVLLFANLGNPYLWYSVACFFSLLGLHAYSRLGKRVRNALTSYLSPRMHRGYEIDYPDTAFENREDPTMHRYRMERPTYPRVVVYGVKR
jgi:hypothetical protein